MRELWRDQHSSVATRRHRPLSLQRLRPLLQDERTEPTPDQAQAKIGECKNPTNFVVFDCRGKPIFKQNSLVISSFSTLYSNLSKISIVFYYIF